jgi:hypothetical protein
LRPRPNGSERLLGDCRQPVAELVRNDDEVALGIEHSFPPDKPCDVGVMAAIGSTAIPVRSILRPGQRPSAVLM